MDCGLHRNDGLTNDQAQSRVTMAYCLLQRHWGSGYKNKVFSYFLLYHLGSAQRCQRDGDII